MPNALLSFRPLDGWIPVTTGYGFEIVKALAFTPGEPYRLVTVTSHNPVEAPARLKLQVIRVPSLETEREVWF